MRPSWPMAWTASQPVRAADVEVGEVVRRRDLQRAGAELRVDALVRDDLELAPQQRQGGRLADDVLVALVVGVHGHGRVAEHRLRPRGGDGDAAAALHLVADVVERAGHVPVRHLEVADGRAAARAPVHQVAVLVDVALLVEGDEHLGDGAHVALVEGEALAVEVARAAQALELLDDGAAVLLAPLPDALATNSSRPRSSLVRPLARSIFSTTFCVAMPAWSVPTSQQAFSPSMRWYRVSTSWMVSLSAWPMCSTPVMLGGGMTMEYGRPLRVGLGVEEVLVEPVLHPARLDGGRLEARGLLQVVVHLASSVGEAKYTERGRRSPRSEKCRGPVSVATNLERIPAAEEILRRGATSPHQEEVRHVRTPRGAVTAALPRAAPAARGRGSGAHGRSTPRPRSQRRPASPGRRSIWVPPPTVTRSSRRAGTGRLGVRLRALRPVPGERPHVRGQVRLPPERGVADSLQACRNRQRRRVPGGRRPRRQRGRRRIRIRRRAERPAGGQVQPHRRRSLVGAPQRHRPLRGSGRIGLGRRRQRLRRRLRLGRAAGVRRQVRRRRRPCPPRQRAGTLALRARRGRVLPERVGL